MSSFADTQKFRIVSKDVNMVALKSLIVEGVSYQYAFNRAVQAALAELERTRSGSGVADQCAVGINGTWHTWNIQLDAVE